jgi:hypothetical protein
MYGEITVIVLPQTQALMAQVSHPNSTNHAKYRISTLPMQNGGLVCLNMEYASFSRPRPPHSLFRLYKVGTLFRA